MTSLKPFTSSDFNVDPKLVKIGEELGKGNFSIVYKGMFEGRQVAVKRQEVVDNDLERYLLNELAILRQMKHEGCIKFYGAFKGDGNVVNILTEYLEGGDLRRLLKDKSVLLGWKYRSKIAIGCARALAYMHSLQLIHRDIKTENVLMSADGTPKLCDFGFARVWDKTKMMTMCGTDEFMAPEIMFGMQYDEKVDVYSFGIMLAELFTRKSPGKREKFLDRNAGEGFNVNSEELDREFQAVNVPPSLVLLTKDCLAAEANDRLSAADMVNWLDDFLKECPADKEPAPMLSADAINEKLKKYLAEEKAEEDMDEKDDDKQGGSSKPTTEEAKHRVQAAVTERDVALAQSVRGFEESPRKKGSNGSSSGSGIFGMCFPGSGSKTAGQANRTLEMSGWVTKRGGRIKTWKRRFMVITPIGIVYFKSPEDQHIGAEAQGTIEFAEMTAVAGVVANAVPTVMTGKANSFGVHTENRTYYISAASADERGKWIRAISDGHRGYLDRKNGKGNKKAETGHRRTQTDSNADNHLKFDVKTGH
jgi:serine/threonine protein kinase